MAGYSGTPLPKKLGITEGSRVALLHAPPEFTHTLGDLPTGATVSSRAGKTHEIIVIFATKRVALDAAIAKHESAIFPAGAIWVAWPKRASKVPTDITEDVVRESCLPRGLVDVKVCAIDDTWSGLKLVWRKGLRS